MFLLIGQRRFDSDRLMDRDGVVLALDANPIEFAVGEQLGSQAGLLTDHNPNTIQSVSVSFSVPLNPKRASTPTCLNMGPIGVLSDGVVLFNALDAQGRDAGAWEVLDASWGHPERTGQYHHHTVPEILAPTTGSAHSGLVGYALDGFGIYGPLGTGGEVLANADLDACHGHTHRITWDGRSKSLYHYHATMEYPYTLGCYAGTPAN